MEQMLFTISGDGSLGYWSLNTSHSSFHCRNNDYDFFRKKVLTCLWERKESDIGLSRQISLLQVVVECMDIGILIPENLIVVIAEDVMVEVDIFSERPAIFPIKIG